MLSSYRKIESADKVGPITFNPWGRDEASPDCGFGKALFLRLPDS